MAKSHTKRRLETRFAKKSVTAPPKEKMKGGTEVDASLHQAKKGFFYTYYKQLLIIPFVMLLAAFIIIGVQVATTGEFLHKGISLKGGTAITITRDMVDFQTISISDVEQTLRSEFPQADLVVRTQRQLTTIVGLEFEVDITDKDELDAFKNVLLATIPELTVENLNQNVRTSGSTLGASFFTQVLIAMIVAFVLMGIVVFIQFRLFVPSVTLILSAFSDIIVTLAIVNILGIKVSAAGIAAFLMLIGYAVDTNILLSTRVLKNKEGTIYGRIISAMKTGLTMSVTSLVAIGIGLIFSESETITQIMTILFIGLLVDVVNTWIQNAGILRWYIEKQAIKKGDAQ